MKPGQARFTAILIITATACMLAAIAVWRFFRIAEPHVELDRTEFPIIGLDISAHNGLPDFDSIASAGVDFVYLKASEGVSFRDKTFLRNYAAARRAGLAVGAYHFFRFECDGARQAVNFINATRGCTFDLPPVIDVEESGNPVDTPTDIIIERIRTMMALISSHASPPIIYTNKTGDARFLREQFDDLEKGDPELWICSFTVPPITRRPWKLWQHSHKAHVPGIKGTVDMNTFNGTREDWLLWLNSYTIQ